MHIQYYKDAELLRIDFTKFISPYYTEKEIIKSEKLLLYLREDRDA